LTSCFCISPPSRPLTSTPFPYTPLFRSAAPPSPRQAIAPTIGAVHRRAAVARKHSEPASAPVDNAQAAAIKKGTEQQRSAATQTDRKSTRLNSSHQIISYAVFCLKKKTQ